ncbi:MAG: pyridoxamine 5'-phosphate oxidase family protein [Oscillospiraceae bacterium]|nr:pyridoxamine 5'-phosphate oxidase family protein [Oscillospiraceae bacterium]
MQEVYEYLKSAETFYLATAEGDQPRVRPFGAVVLFEGKLYILTGKAKAVSKQLHANPKAEICACKDGTWLRVSGELVPDERTAPQTCMLDSYPALRSMYSENDGNIEMLYLRNATAVFSSFTAPPRTVKF